MELMEFKDYKTEHLKETVQDMTHIAIIQVQKTKQTLFKNDADLVLEILSNLKRIVVLKHKIDYDCKNYLALHTPVAVDLRLILASLRISSSLGKIAGHIEKICRIFKKNREKLKPELLHSFSIYKMFDTAIQMLYEMQEAMGTENSSQAGEIFKRDLLLNKIKLEANQIAQQIILSNPEDTDIILSVLEIIHKLERIGDEAKNISERLIFYYEAKVVRHTSYYKGRKD